MNRTIRGNPGRDRNLRAVRPPANGSVNPFEPEEKENAMINQIYPEAGNELAKQSHDRMLKAAANDRLAASARTDRQGSPRSAGRHARRLAYAVVLVLISATVFASIVWASAGGGSGGGSPFSLM
jgi:hypothetical protein